MDNNIGDAVSAVTYRLFVFGLGLFGLVLLTAPIVIVLMMSFTDGQTLQFPPEGFSLRWYQELLDPIRSGTEHIAALNSLKIAAMAVGGALLFAVPAAIGMARLSSKASTPVETLLLSPLVLPSLVYGLAALVVANLVGITPSIWLVAMGHIVVFGPLMYRSAAALTQGRDGSLEDASTVMGAGWMRTLGRVTLPLLAPGIAAGSFLVFIHSIDNVSVSLFLADPQTTVLPLRMFALIQETLDVRVAAMSGVLIALTLVGMLAWHRVLAPARK
jgi:putative spermidine/putrescine transport system permease protein